MIKSDILNKALKSAKSSNVIQGKIGAVLFTDGGYIITSACNVKYYGDKDKNTIHAEEYIIHKALKLNAFRRFKTFNLLIVRFKPSTKAFANARPCEKCALLLNRFPEIKIYHSNERGEIITYE
jgi:cytidine deaminase